LKFLIDAQLPPALAGWMRAKGHDAAALREIGLRDAADAAIWHHAFASNAIVVTKDEDFFLLATARPGSQVLWVRTGNLVNRLLLARFEQAWPEILAHLEAGIVVVELR
jgi:predicted nuclease of predicted toxin-antitoxin system